MYSRAVRKFATDPNDRYPNVAPGVYTKEMELNEYGKRTDLQTRYYS